MHLPIGASGSSDSINASRLELFDKIGLDSLILQSAVPSGGLHSSYWRKQLRTKPTRRFAGGGLATAAEITRRQGRQGDSMLVHMNAPEFARLSQSLGPPTKNPHTGMPEFFTGGDAATIAGPLLADYFGAGSAVGGALGATGDNATTIGDALVGAGIGGLSQKSWSGALAGGAMGALGGGGGSQIGSLMSKDPATAKLIGNALLGAVAGHGTSVGTGAGATLGGLSSMLSSPSTGGSGASTAGGGGASTGASADSVMGPPKTLSQQAGSDTSGLSPLLKKYWPVIISALAAAHKNPAQTAPALPPGMTSHLQQLQMNRMSTPYQGNYYTYGQQPEHSYFSNNQLPAYTPTPPGSAHGGTPQVAPGGLSQASRYVQGPGSGRSDDINARLSNNEYVMDADTVSMLGDGSPDAGAKKLDRMRSNIRKHKGRAMVKGKMSPDSKEPEDYLSGGEG
jgi:hypothetical protein